MPTLFGKLGRRFRGISRFVGSRFTANSALLLYHRVAEDPWDPFQLCVSPGRFAGQLDALPSLGKVLDISEFIRRQREGSLEKGSLCLTFDDGYVDFLENALPLLEARGLPATIYCVAEGLGQALWWDRLHDCLDVAPGSPSLSLESAAGALALPAGWSRPDAFQRLYSFLKALPAGERSAQLAALERTLAVGALPQGRRLMTAEEIAEVAAHPLVTIGAHTLSHSSLAALDPETQFAEIAGSMSILSQIANRPVTTFSYPYGLRGRDFDAVTADAARRAGFDHALAADSGVVTHRSDPMAMPRLWVHDEDGPAFARRVRRWL